jgi:hypothetical protein
VRCCRVAPAPGGVHVCRGEPPSRPSKFALHQSNCLQAEAKTAWRQTRKIFEGGREVRFPSVT